MTERKLEHSYPDSCTSLEDFQILSILGQGSNGIVYKAYWKFPNPKPESKNATKPLQRLVALKEVKINEAITKKRYKDVINEVEMMKKIKHPQIIELYDSFIDRQLDSARFKKNAEKSLIGPGEEKYRYGDVNHDIMITPEQTKSQRNPHTVTGARSLYIAMEYAESGDMQSLINRQKHNRKYFSEKEIWQVAWQLALALLHCHSHDIIHRDVKPLNVLLTKDHQFKLGDLSESTMVNKEKYLKTKTVGTPLFLSPEIIKK